MDLKELEALILKKIEEAEDMSRAIDKRAAFRTRYNKSTSVAHYWDGKRAAYHEILDALFGRG